MSVRTFPMPTRPATQTEAAVWPSPKEEQSVAFKDLLKRIRSNLRSLEDHR